MYTAVLVALLGSGAEAADAPPVVVELFTSQSCYACPPAEALLGELAGRSDIIALEFHVDYWNDLVYGLAGRWIDVHSSPAYTERQRRYATRLPGGGVYTPQAVVNGRREAVGSRTREVERAIAAAQDARVPRTAMTVEATPSGLTIRIDRAAPMPPVPLWLVRYRLRETTRVGAGENRGKTLANHHVVTSLAEIGTWSGDAAVIAIPLELAPGEGCAVLAQGRELGPILAAAACPKSLASAG